MENYSKEAILEEISKMELEGIAEIIYNLRKMRSKQDKQIDASYYKIGDLQERIKELEVLPMHLEQQLAQVGGELVEANYNLLKLTSNKNASAIKVGRLEKEIDKLKIDLAKLTSIRNANSTKLEGLKKAKVSLEKEVEALNVTVDKLKLELTNSKVEVYNPPPKYHKMGTEEFYRDLKKCARLVETKSRKTGNGTYKSWGKVMEALRQEPTVMHYIEANNVKLTVDNVKRWLKVANKDGGVNVKPYNQAKGYKK